MSGESWKPKLQKFANTACAEAMREQVLRPFFELLLWMNINKIINRELIFEKLFQNQNVSQMKFTLEFQRIKCVRKGWFPVSRNFHLRTCVKFTLVDKIEVTRKRTFNFSFKLSPSYLASILFPWSKFTCVNVRNQKRVSGNQLKFLNQCDENFTTKLSRYWACFLKKLFVWI